MNLFKKETLRCLIALTACMSSTYSWGADYPEKTVKWVVGFPPGGGTDILARTISAELSKELKQQFVVENKVGAGGAIAAQSVSREKADGYTLLTADIAILALNPAIYKTLQYNAQSDFIPIGLMAQFPLLIATHPTSGIKSMGDLVEQGKKTAGVDYGSAGIGTPHHVAMEAMLATTAASAQHVPYKGDAPAMQDLLGGQLPVAVLAPSLALPSVLEGKLVPLAVTSERRLPQLPDVPTLLELGYSNAPVYAWQGLVAPKGTPARAVDTLSGALKTALAKPEVQERLTMLGMEPLDANPASMTDHVAKQQAFWKQLITSRNLAQN